MSWPTLILSLIPELVRGIISICRDKYAAEKAQAEAKKAEVEQAKLQGQKE